MHLLKCYSSFVISVLFIVYKFCNAFHFQTSNIEFIVEDSANRLHLLLPSCSQPSLPLCPSFVLPLQCNRCVLRRWRELCLGFQWLGDDFCLAPRESVTYLHHARSRCSSRCLPFSIFLLSHAANYQSSVRHTEETKAFVFLIVSQSENESRLLCCEAMTTAAVLTMHGHRNGPSTKCCCTVRVADG